MLAATRLPIPGVNGPTMRMFAAPGSGRYLGTSVGVITGRLEEGSRLGNVPKMGRYFGRHRRDERDIEVLTGQNGIASQR